MLLLFFNRLVLEASVFDHFKPNNVDRKDLELQLECMSHVKIENNV